MMLPLLLLKKIIIKLVPSKIYFGKKNFQYFTGYLYDDYKIKMLHIMLPKPTAYVKTLMVKLNECTFLLKMITY